MIEAVVQWQSSEGFAMVVGDGRLLKGHFAESEACERALLTTRFSRGNQLYDLSIALFFF